MSPRLSIIPAGAVTDPSLEPRDLQVLCLLGRHTDKDSGWCRRSQVKMAREISCGRATLQRSLERLVDAGWVQKRQWNVPEGVEPGQPSASYLYRVILDRDDFGAVARDETDDEAAESHASDASDSREGVPTSGHPARPDGQGVPTHARAPRTSLTNEEGERDARARDRKARFLVAFEARWPTAGADSRQRTAYAAEALSEAEETAALDGIAPFLEMLKRHKRKHVPAGFTYLEEKRWMLLEQAKSQERQGTYHDEGSDAAKAIAVAYAIGGKSDFFRSVMQRPGVKLYYPHNVDARLLALAAAPGMDAWPIVDYRQAAAWEEFLRAYVTVQTRNRFTEGARAPWPWPPSVDGRLYVDGADPPPPEPIERSEGAADGANMVPDLTDDDRDALAKERMR